MLKEAGISLSKSTAFMNANTEDLQEGVISLYQKTSKGLSTVLKKKKRRQD